MRALADAVSVESPPPGSWTVSSNSRGISGSWCLSLLRRTLNLSTTPGILFLHNNSPSRKEEEV